ncbi:hypothetical protein K439DRAFT_50801 [Ramaria rubella]|nr:hypothetical protein K439DRAFT_50801 [Ramaria rubella]
MSMLSFQPLPVLHRDFFAVALGGDVMCLFSFLKTRQWDRCISREHFVFFEYSKTVLTSICHWQPNAREACRDSTRSGSLPVLSRVSVHWHHVPTRPDDAKKNRRRRKGMFVSPRPLPLTKLKRPQGRCRIIFCAPHIAFHLTGCLFLVRNEFTAVTTARGKCRVNHGNDSSV